jgi:hypothetical protein
MQWKTVAAVAALATGSALTACGAEGTAARLDPPVVAAPDAPASVPSATVETVLPAVQATVAEPATPADANASELVRGPVIPAAQLRRQILALLESLEKLEDLERDNVERAFGVRMNIDPQADDGYTYFADTTEGWLYRVDISHFSPKGSPATVEIFLSNGVDYSDNSTNHQPTYCTLEFEPLAKQLVAMGYERDARAYKRGGDMTLGFGRDVPEHNAGFGVEVLIYGQKAANGQTIICIKGFRIGGGAFNG